MLAKCPTCGKAAVKPRPENQAFPFCSERCRLADLGRWLNEEFRIPTDEAPDGDGGGSQPDESGDRRKD
jgi:endogenous inhibitor of DNA gyrase (YacG/DUF329 family)